MNSVINGKSKIQNPKSKIAYVFPGQGSQFVGMGKDFYENFSIAREVFNEADDALGFRLSKMCFAGTAEDLAQTENTQPAILTVSIAAFRILESEGLPTPDFVAGHSLGEYSALVAAGAISFADAVKVVKMRGRFMQEAVPVGIGAMAAILGADLQTVIESCAEAAGSHVCSAANMNAPMQTVIAGHAAAVDRAIEILKSRGAKRAIKLNVSAPFHCALMQPAQEKLAAKIREIKFENLRFPCVTNVETQPNGDGERAKELLIRQVTTPVRWTQTVEFFNSVEVQTFIEVGAGKVLSGLIRQTLHEAILFNVEDSSSLVATKTALST
jgi:[acyl-carrier-protein] S-malonyltransferase